MKRILLVLVALAAAMLLCLPASADHSVLPKEGDLNETQAVDAMVTLLCRRLNCSEEDIRGHWHYFAVYYPKARWLDGFDGSAWSVTAEPAKPLDGVSYAEAAIDAQTGDVIRWDEDTEGVWADDPDSRYRVPLIPRKDQMQPAEAVECAIDLLTEALEAHSPHEDASLWCDYMLFGSSDESGRFWYHVILGSDDDSPWSWHVWLDANTGDVIWQTDAERFAHRCIYLHTGMTYEGAYRYMLAQFEERWGSSMNWNYIQAAEFEEQCFGHPSWPEPHHGLPNENECSYDEACAAAIAFLSGNDSTSGSWTVVRSIFYVDPYGWTHDLLARGITENEHLWALWLVSVQAPSERVLVYVDPDTGEVTDGPLG